ncbi:hypothetical protein EVAR_94457_1 [Eumeta japonica]|uniref:Uncharacterized protein n=1 Tax=Eumeta variegata TaxID=151549 RepID=A0A4C1ZPI6_EUMVA|nr:hypothetical protein EVAR_94457_1 [Eumeta japonica]
MIRVDACYQGRATVKASVSNPLSHGRRTTGPLWKAARSRGAAAASINVRGNPTFRLSCRRPSDIYFSTVVFFGYILRLDFLSRLVQMRHVGSTDYIKTNIKTGQSMSDRAHYRVQAIITKKYTEKVPGSFLITSKLSEFLMMRHGLANKGHRRQPQTSPLETRNGYKRSDATTTCDNIMEMYGFLGSDVTPPPVNVTRELVARSRPRRHESNASPCVLSGNFDVKDKPHSGQPVTYEVILEKEQKSSISSYDLTEELGIDH